MLATRIIAIRHGQTDWNAQARLQGQLDIPLNALGRRQAATLADALRLEGLAAVLTSDLGRAWHTGPALARRWHSREPDFAPQGAESLRDLSARTLACVERLAAAHAGCTIALVSHGGVLDCLYRAATRLALDAPRTWVLPNAAIHRLLHTPQGLSLVGWNDGAHLDGLALDDPVG